MKKAKTQTFFIHDAKKKKSFRKQEDEPKASSSSAIKPKQQNYIHSKLTLWSERYSTETHFQIMRLFQSFQQAGLLPYTFQATMKIFFPNALNKVMQCQCDLGNILKTKRSMPSIRQQFALKKIFKMEKIMNHINAKLYHWFLFTLNFYGKLIVSSNVLWFIVYLLLNAMRTLM